MRSEIQHSLKLVTDELAAVQLACTQSQQDLISKREHLKTHLEEKQELTLNLKELKERKIALETQESSIRAKLAAFARTTLQAHHIANFLRLQEKDQEEASALTIFRKEMRAHVK